MVLICSSGQARTDTFTDFGVRTSGRHLLSMRKCRPCRTFDTPRPAASQFAPRGGILGHFFINLWRTGLHLGE